MKKSLSFKIKFKLNFICFIQKYGFTTPNINIEIITNFTFITNVLLNEIFGEIHARVECVVWAQSPPKLR
jgi:hypothetical protein